MEGQKSERREETADKLLDREYGRSEEKGYVRSKNQLKNKVKLKHQ